MFFTACYLTYLGPLAQRVYGLLKTMLTKQNKHSPLHSSWHLLARLNQGSSAIFQGSPQADFSGRSGSPAKSTPVSALSPLPGFLPLTRLKIFSCGFARGCLCLDQGRPGGEQYAFLISSWRGKCKLLGHRIGKTCVPGWT